MPQAGGAINRPPVKRKPAPKPAPRVAPGRARETAQNVTQTKGASGSSSSSGTSANTNTRVTSASNISRTKYGGATQSKADKKQAVVIDHKVIGGGPKGGGRDRTQRSSQKSNADKFGFKQPAKRNRSGGTAVGGGGGSVGDGFRSGGGGNLGRPDGGGIATSGANDGGRLGGSFRDSDLVGSSNTIDDFDGSSFSGGFDDVEGGGGGSGSSLAGRESVGLADVKQGESLEDVVYGVKKKGRKVSRARGE